MATSFHGKASGRAEDTLDAIRDALGAGDWRKAMWLARDYAPAELKHVAKHRSADAALFAAEMAAVIWASASGFHDHRPGRPEGCGADPGPADLLAMFDAAVTSQLAEAERRATARTVRKEARANV